MFSLVVAIVLAVVFGSIGYQMGSRRGHPAAGLFLCLLTGVVGVLILCFIPTTDFYDRLAGFSVTSSDSYEHKLGPSLAPPPEAPITPSNTPEDRLDQLARLFAEAKLEEGDYQAQRARILAEL